MCVYVCLSVCVQGVGGCVSHYVCLCVCVSGSVSLFGGVGVFEGWSVSLCVAVSVSVCVCLYVGVCVGVRVWVCR